MSAAVTDSVPLAESAELRANCYRLLGALLVAPPNEQVLAVVMQLEAGGDGGLCESLDMLRVAAERANLTELDDEYHALFIGVGRGELVPYGSWYMTGFLMDQPLALLRQQLDRLGFTRQPEVKEPEDHAAALCEAMALLIGRQDLTFQDQQQFFSVHIKPWMIAFFEDLQSANNARFYRAVGQLGKRFLEFEAQYFAMPA